MTAADLHAQAIKDLDNARALLAESTGGGWKTPKAQVASDIARTGAFLADEAMNLEREERYAQERAEDTATSERNAKRSAAIQDAKGAASKLLGVTVDAKNHGLVNELVNKVLAL